MRRPSARRGHSPIITPLTDPTTNHQRLTAEAGWLFLPVSESDFCVTEMISDSHNRIPYQRILPYRLKPFKGEPSTDANMRRLSLSYSSVGRDDQRTGKSRCLGRLGSTPPIHALMQGS